MFGLFLIFWGLLVLLSLVSFNQNDPSINHAVSNVTKPATLETGVVIQVPIFVNTGDRIKVDTRTNAYLGRE